MSRGKITTKMINYLEKRVNCENIIKFVDRLVDMHNKNKLLVGEIPVFFDIVPYNDNSDYKQKSVSDPKDNQWIQKKFETFDIMTESNHIGFEYFPYLYGVLNCHDGERSKVYIFYEFFDGSLIKLIDNMEHPSEWYDVVFQMTVIDYYLKTSGYDYSNAIPENHFYRKLEKPYYKEYLLNNIKFNINHKYLIVMGIWVDIFEKSEEKNPSNISLLLKYLEENKEQIKIPPSQRIIKLLNDLNDHPENIPDVLSSYYR